MVCTKQLENMENFLMHLQIFHIYTKCGTTKRLSIGSKLKLVHAKDLENYKLGHDYVRIYYLHCWLNDRGAT